MYLEYKKGLTQIYLFMNYISLRIWHTLETLKIRNTQLSDKQYKTHQIGQ